MFFLSGFSLLWFFYLSFSKKSYRFFWKILKNFLKNHMDFYKKKPCGFFDCYGFSSSFFFVMVFHSSDKSKKSITKEKLDKKNHNNQKIHMVFFEKSIWFFFKFIWFSFENSYGFLLKIHKDFSEIHRVFFTKTITKKKQIKNP